MSNRTKKNKSKSANKQAKNNRISSDKGNELSSEKDTPPALCSENGYKLPDTVFVHCEVSVPSPDDAALPNASSCPVIRDESQVIQKTKEAVGSADDQGKEILVSTDKKKKEPLGGTKKLPDVKDKKVSSTKKPKNGEDLNCKLLTDYYQVRRSSRKVLSVQSQKQKFVEEAIQSGTEEGFKVKEFPGKGRAVITNKEIKRGDFVLEYSGELLNFSEARERELKYSTQKDIGCFMYYFKHKDKQMCVDATKETGRLGRLVNHSKKGNLKTQHFLIDELPHLVFVATRDIAPGEELLYDYGDRRKKALEFYPWLAS